MAGSKYKFAFVMDPLHTVLVDKDTTFVMMLEAQARGHQIYFVGLKDMFCLRARARCAGRFDAKCRRAVDHYKLLDGGVEMPLDAFDAIFMRKDPPADANYIYATMLLSLADAHRTFVINSPAGVEGGQREALSAKFSRRHTAHPGHLRERPAQELHGRAGR